MTLKRKLTWGLGFLFLIIFALCAVCSYYVGALGQESERILKDNYSSLVYARNMFAGLDDMKASISSTLYNTGTMSDYYGRLFESGRKLFEANLKDENNNITEPHEKEYVEALSQEYDSYLKLCLQLKTGRAGGRIYFGDFLPASEKLRQSINAIYDVNMQAVIRKSQVAKRDASRFNSAMAMTGAICLVLALGYFWYFPLYISSTLSYLADKMKELLKKTGVELDMKTNDEADIILHSISLLEHRVDMKNRGAI